MSEIVDRGLQFQRIYHLVIGNAASGKALVIDSLQIQFTVSLDMDLGTANKNTLNLSIYNLSDESLEYFKDSSQGDIDAGVVALEAGYYGSTLRPVFTGNIYQVKTRQQGADRITDIQAEMGYKKFYYSQDTVTVGAGAPVKDVLERLMKQAGLSIGAMTGDVFEKEFPFGYSSASTAENSLYDLSRSLGFQYTLEGDTINFVEEKLAHPVTIDAPVLYTDFSTGLLEAPSPSLTMVATIKKKQYLGEGLTIKSLLNGDIRPQRAVIIKNADTGEEQVFKVAKVKHTGDYIGGNWTTEAELVTFNQEALRAHILAKKKTKKNQQEGTDAGA